MQASCNGASLFRAAGDGRRKRAAIADPLSRTAEIILPPELNLLMDRRGK